MLWRTILGIGLSTVRVELLRASEAYYSVEPFTQLAEVTMKVLREAEFGCAIVDVDAHDVDVVAKLRSLGYGGPIIGLSELARTKAGEDLEITFLQRGGSRLLPIACSQRLLETTAAIVMRRDKWDHRNLNGADKKSGATLFAFYNDRIVVCPERAEAFFDEAPLQLGPAERRLLTYFAQNPGTTLSREQICQTCDIPLSHARYPLRNVDSMVKRLRKVLHKIEPKSMAIRSVYGVGYKIAP